MKMLLAISVATAAATGCLADELDTSELESELSVWSWQDDERIPDQRTSRPVGTAFFRNQIYMVHNGSSSPSELWWTTRDQTSGDWSTNIRIEGQRAATAPALVVFRNQLHMIYKAANQRNLVMSTFQPATRTAPATWSLPVFASTAVNERVDTTPSAVVVGGRMYLAYCKTSGGRYRMQVDMLDAGGQWQAVAELGSSVDFPCRNVAIGATGNTLHATWVRDRDPRVVSSSVMSTRDGTVSASGAVTWGPEQRLSFRSKKALSITTCGGNTHFTHGGDDNPNEIWWTYRVGSRWLDDVRVPNQASSGGATLGCANGVPYMIHNGGDDQLWYSEFR